MATRYIPTTEGAALIRTALKAAGVSARVAKKSYAYRVVSDDPRVATTLASLGLAGPLPTMPVANSAINNFFAYDFVGLAR